MDEEEKKKKPKIIEQMSEMLFVRKRIADSVAD